MAGVGAVGVDLEVAWAATGLGPGQAPLGGAVLASSGAVSARRTTPVALITAKAPTPSRRTTSAIVIRHPRRPRPPTRRAAGSRHCCDDWYDGGVWLQVRVRCRAVEVHSGGVRYPDLEAGRYDGAARASSAPGAGRGGRRRSSAGNGRRRGRGRPAGRRRGQRPRARPGMSTPRPAGRAGTSAVGLGSAPPSAREGVAQGGRVPVRLHRATTAAVLVDARSSVVSVI